MRAAAKAVALGAVLCLVSACTSDDDGSSDDEPSDEGALDVTVSFVPAGSATAEGAELDRAVEIVRDRIEGLGVADDAVDVSRDGDTIVVRLADGDAVDRIGDVVEAQGTMLFRPVLLEVTGPAAADLEATAPADDVADQPVTLPGDDAAVFQLGPAMATGSMIETAEAAIGQTGEWEVRLTLREGPEGIDLFNEMAASCFVGTARPVCPTGQVAIVLDSVVQSAPSIQVASFERDQISIVGNFETEDAEELALVLRSGSLPFPLQQESVETADD